MTRRTNARNTTRGLTRTASVLAVLSAVTACTSVSTDAEWGPTSSPLRTEAGPAGPSPVAPATTAPPEEGVTTTSAPAPDVGFLPLSADLPTGHRWSWRSTWPEPTEGTTSSGAGEQHVVFLEGGCQLSHFVVSVSDVPLSDLDATHDRELTDLASRTGTEGENWSPAAARVRAEMTTATDRPADMLEFRLTEPETLTASDGTTWTIVQALRASRAADVLLSVLLSCPRTAGMDASEQQDLLVHRLDGLTVVATEP